MAEALFDLCAGLVVYVYAGYPLLMAALARLRRGAISTPTVSDEHLATVSMIIPAHNERENIEAKLANCETLSYPEGRLEILVISDGSTDGTADLVRSAADGRIRLIELSSRSGKAAALNAGLAEARGDVLVFTDASILLEPDAVRQLARHFASPAVGCVSGEDLIEGGGGEGLYGRYELFIRRQESAVASIVGASGSLYAQRRSLCDPFPPNVAPDFVSVLRTVERGARAVSEPGARGFMAAVASSSEEFQRKVRTLLRGMTTLARYPQLLNPLRFGMFSVALWSHKIGRWLVPLFLLTLMVTNLVLAPRGLFYKLTLLLQIAFYLAAAIGWVWRGSPVASSLPIRVALYFTAGNAASIVAGIRYLAGERQEIWAPSRRASQKQGR